MKFFELFEQTHLPKPKEEKLRQQVATNWRIQISKDLTRFNKLFGVLLLKPQALNKHTPHVALIGGEYSVMVLDEESFSLPKEKRFELWKKAYAQKIYKLVQDGYKLYVGGNVGSKS